MSPAKKQDSEIPIDKVSRLILIAKLPEEHARNLNEYFSSFPSSETRPALTPNLAPFWYVWGRGVDMKTARQLSSTPDYTNTKFA